MSLGVAVLVALGLLYLVSPRATHVGLGELAPDFDLPLVDAPDLRTGRLSAHRGRLVLLSFFEPGCEACPGHVDALERLYRRHLRRGLAVVGVSVGKDHAAALLFLRERAVTFTVFEDPGGRRTGRDWGLRRLPETYLLDAEGRVKRGFTEPLSRRDLALDDLLVSLLPPEPASPRP